MEILIETLTGTAFEVRVSPFETVMSVKAKIQRLEGIPISQQHLIWQSNELQDEFCLHDYNVYDGATLKLVLAMRGGPINTRRIPVEDSTLREMAEYMEANREDICDKVPGNRQVTILVFREGDQLNFFRFVDRGDGTLTPLSDTYSSASMLNDDPDDNDDNNAQAAESDARYEHDSLKEKMMNLKARMDKLALELSTPSIPSSSNVKVTQPRRSHPSSKSLCKTQSTFSKTPCLPPVGHTLGRLVSKEDRLSSCDVDELNFNSSEGEISPSNPEVIFNKLKSGIVTTPEPVTCGSADAPDSMVCSKSVLSPTPLLEGGNMVLDTAEYIPETSTITSDSLSAKTNRKHCRPLTSSKRDLAPLCNSASLKAKTQDVSIDVKNQCTTHLDSKVVTRDRHLDKTRVNSSSTYLEDYTLHSIREALMRSSSKYDTHEQTRDEGLLDNLAPNEAKGMSSLFKQATIEKLGTARIDTFLPSVSAKPHHGAYTGTGLRAARHQTPEAALASSLLRMSAQRDNRISPTYRLPPVKNKKKTTKRCLLCAKKTGLATSYVCRCGNNFCATHRYAETHGCSYDYKTEGRRILEQNNPVVAAPKLPKI